MQHCKVAAHNAEFLSLSESSFSSIVNRTCSKGDFYAAAVLST